MNPPIGPEDPVPALPSAAPAAGGCERCACSGRGFGARAGRVALVLAAIAGALTLAGQAPGPAPRATGNSVDWKQRLTSEQYRVLRQKGTEAAFTGRYWNHHEPGAYRCAGCGQPLFDSADKFDSGTGWPSFVRPKTEAGVRRETDTSLGMTRTEVQCSACGGHLGHLFDDGPAPTGLRYCINSAALRFEPAR